MRKEYSPWEFSGYAWSTIRITIDELKEGNVTDAIKGLEDILEQYQILNKVNGLTE